MSRHLREFIFELAKAGDMVGLPTTERRVPILASPQQREHLPPDLARDGWELVVCDTSAKLESLLYGGHAAWQEYLGELLNKNPRAQLLGPTPGSRITGDANTYVVCHIKFLWRSVLCGAGNAGQPERRTELPAMPHNSLRGLALGKSGMARSAKPPHLSSLRFRGFTSKCAETRCNVY